MFVSSVQIRPREGRVRTLLRGTDSALYFKTPMDREVLDEIRPADVAPLVEPYDFHEADRSADMVLVIRDVTTEHREAIRDWVETCLPPLARSLTKAGTGDEDFAAAVTSLVLGEGEYTDTVLADAEYRLWGARSVRSFVPHVEAEGLVPRTASVPLTLVVLEGILVVAWWRPEILAAGLVESFESEAYPSDLPERRKLTAGEIANAYTAELASRFQAAARELERILEQWEVTFYGTLSGQEEQEGADREVDVLEHARPLHGIRRALSELVAEVDLLETRKLSGHWISGGTRRPPEVEDEMQAAVATTTRVREDVRDSFALIAAATAGRQLDLSRQIQESAQEEQRQVDQIQRRIGVLSVLFLVPSVVAAVYGANDVELPGGGDAGARTAWMFGIMAALALLLLWRELRRQRR